MIVAIFAHSAKNRSKSIAIEIRDFFSNHGVQAIFVDEEEAGNEADSLANIDPKKIDFIVSIGGDGTILHIMHSHPEIDAPIVAVNLGGLGFMADIPIDEVYTCLEALLKGQFTIQHRLMMQGTTGNNRDCFAINEIAVHRSHNPSLIELAVYDDGNYLNTFAADGLIVATPTGSTAYSLAAGGPILTPELEAFVLTPISPHTISNRPIVLMPKQELQVHYLGEYERVEVTYDGCKTFPLHPGEVVSIKMSERKFKLVSFPQYDYFATLRTKLGWSGKLKK